MRRLFYKIFLWFWLAIIVVSVTLVGFTASEHSRVSEDEHWSSKYGPLVDLWAQREAEIYDREGQPGLQQYDNKFVIDPATHSYMFDSSGTETLGRAVPQRIAQIASEVASSHEIAPQFFTSERIIAKKTVTPSGRAYVGVVEYPQPSVLRRRLFEFVIPDIGAKDLFRLLSVIVVAGLFCFWLARQITNPIGKLRVATREIANERLETRVDHAVLTRRDELADLGRDFDRMAQRLDSLVTAQRRLLADVSHTLRSPLARLSVALGLAREGVRPETSKHLDRIELECERLNTLIGQLLTMSRVDSGIDLDQKKRFDLAVLLEEITADGDYEARGNRRSVELVSAARCTVEGVPEMLRGAIENVVRNAVRYTAEGTSVKVSMDCHETPSGGRAVIQVRDHGPGVPQEELAEIFVPFHRLPDNLRQDGTGLGLAITERTMRFHNGTVSAANALGGGLVVTLELPVVAWSASEAANKIDQDVSASLRS
jgi:two-component system, OmpR family, sensor histidine kinase CpxA